jgi:lipopolysaccharide transport system permease protein
MTAIEKDSATPETLPVHTYSSERKFGLLKTFKSLIKEFPVAHSLGYRFAERTIKSRYRQSLLGVLWAFLPPISTAIIWIILYESRVVNISDVGVPYPLFVITGTMLWSVFSTALLMPMQIMQANRSILVKINFPREALLVNAFYEILFNTGIAFIIIIAELLIFGVHVDFHSLLFIPAVFLLIFLGMALGLLLLPLSLLYKDVQFALPSVLQFAMYLTPVVYATPIYKGAGKILALNPVTPVLTSARAWLLGLDLSVPIILQRITVAILIERMGS